MQRTVWDTPVVAAPFRWFSKFMLKIMGWRLEGDLPDVPRCVAVIAPHTSNWDFPLVMFFVFALRFTVSWVAKHTMFRPPFGIFFRFLGGIPVERSRSHNLVQQVVETIEGRERIWLGITPEGTRAKVKAWKTGFYRIALGARIPMALVYLDYGRKVVGVGPIIEPTGDIEADMAKIHDFYVTITPRHPDRFTLPCIDPEKMREMKAAGDDARA